MRILVVAPQFRPLVGGYETQLDLLTREWVKAGHRVSVVTERRVRSPRTERSAGVHILRVPVVLRKGLHGASASIGQALVLPLFRPAAVVLTGIPTLPLRALLRVICRRGTVRLCRLPTTAPLATEGGEGLQAKALRRFLAQPSSAVVVMSRRMRAEVQAALGSRTLVHLIPNGVSIPSAVSPTPNRLPDGSLRLLFLGRLAEEKAPFLALEVVARLVRAGVRVALTIIGDGPERSAVLCRVGALGLTTCVQLLGPAADAQRHLASADLLLQTSPAEGMSNVILEAMAAGIPFVTTAASGAEDIPPKDSVAAGVVVETRDAAQIARLLQDLLASPSTLRAMGAAGRAIAQEYYRPAGMAAKYLAVMRAPAVKEPG